MHHLQGSNYYGQFPKCEIDLLLGNLEADLPANDLKTLKSFVKIKC